MVLLGAGVLIVFDVLGGFGRATGVLWSLLGALLFGFMIAELPDGAEIDIADFVD